MKGDIMYKHTVRDRIFMRYCWIMFRITGDFDWFERGWECSIGM